jgi:hypothetical protein
MYSRRGSFLSLEGLPVGALFEKVGSLRVEENRVPAIGARSVVEPGFCGGGEIGRREGIRGRPRKGAFGLEALRGVAYGTNEGPSLLAVQVGREPGIPLCVVHDLPLDE